MISCHLHEEWWQEERQREITSRFLCHNFVLNRTEEHFLECHYQKVCRSSSSSSSSEYMYGCVVLHSSLTQFLADICWANIINTNWKLSQHPYHPPCLPCSQCRTYCTQRLSHRLPYQLTITGILCIRAIQYQSYLSIHLTICSEGPTK